MTIVGSRRFAVFVRHFRLAKAIRDYLAARDRVDPPGEREARERLEEILRGLGI